MKVKFQHRFLVVAIALVTIFSIAMTASAQDDANSLRIYGENGYGAAFPYTDPEAPFDPMNEQAPMKDFVTFNPAMLEDSIVVNNIDSKQKVFARQWFVPEYVEPTGMVWLDDFRCVVQNGNDTSTALITEDESERLIDPSVLSCEWIPNHNEYTWEDVVTDYTYMFVDKHYQPREATAKSPTRSYWTTFWFPIADNDDEQIGLDGYDMNYDGEDDMVVLKKVGDFNFDGYKDVQISSEMMAVNVGDKVQFLDHIVEVEGVYYDGEGEIDRVAVKIFYTGNDEPEQIGELWSVNVGEKNYLSSGRHTVSMNRPQFYEPWYLEIDATSVGSEKVLMTVGRQLYTRETFFVDGAEYDVAMIYGSAYDSVKYITIRNPVPEHKNVEINDLSIVKEMVDNEESLPLLPPYNKVHTMVDDINIPHTETCCEYTGYVGSTLNSAASDGEWYEDDCILANYDTIEERKIYNVDPLNIYFIDKTNEPRFHTDLLEILDEGAELSNIEDTEAWKWLHIRTMPDFYKDFVYPELPDIDDGTGDFLFTSSFVAENSMKCEDFAEYICDPNNFVWPQRIMFTYDQETGAEDIYVNEIDTETNGLRVYGEDNMDAAFPYTDPEAPFDPLNAEAPQKDFVTLNPAKIKAGIVVDNKDSHEKVFFRQWFVPEYDEPTGRVWLDKPNKYIWEDVVNEYTYMFIDKHYQPTAGTATPQGNPSNPWDVTMQEDSFWTYFWFPAADNDASQVGLDSFDINYDGKDDKTYLMAAADFNSDGRKDIALGSELFALAVGDKIQFLDHIVEIEGIYYDGEGEIDRVAVKVFYNGNNEQNPTYPGPEQIGGLYSVNVEQGVLSAGRHTVSMNLPDFYEPWAMQILGTSSDSSKVLIRVGRLLHTGESFFVDGAEYAVPMIYGPEENSVKYITIRNPIPEHQDVKLNDLSVTKEMVDDNEIMPVLPPFNREHIMIDDIDVPHSVPDESMTCYYGQWYDSSAGNEDLLWYHDMYINSVYDTISKRMFTVPATEIYFTGKDYEDRFHTNLLELLRECQADETWKWLHIYTMPDFYKEFVYPDVPNAGGSGDYLLTSSFTAPNTVLCESVEIPPVYPRMMFTYDPTDGTGLYMNGGAPAVEPPVDEIKGDYDGNEIVNFDDFVEFAACYNSVMGDSNYNAIFDFDDDGDVDFDDFVEFAGVYQS
jgi:hypothetical protein